MMKPIIFLIFAFIHFQIYPQTALKEILDSISANSLHIKSVSLSHDANVLNAHTGTLPSDPELEYGYFPGNKNEIGTKTTFSISQSFYFPTVYARKIDDAQLVSYQSYETNRLEKRQILIEAAKQYIALVYLDKYLTELQGRNEDAIHVQNLIKKSVAAGEANQLEMNKAQLEALRWNNQLNLYLALKEEKEKLLVAMNNGKPLGLNQPAYPEWNLPHADSIIKTILANDAVLRSMEYEEQIAENNIRLQQSLSLPKFTAGYGQETILGDAYRGVQTGVSIPLWQQKNTVKHARILKQSAENNTLAYRQRLVSDIGARYKIVIALEKNYHEYEKIIATVRSKELLQKSLESGNISVIEYYRELLPWYDMYDQYLIATRDYYTELLNLMQYDW